MKIFYPFLILLFASCGTPTSEVKPAKLSAITSRHFDLVENGSEVLLKLFDPNTGKIEQEITIDQTKAHKVICLSTTSLGMFLALDKSDVLIGVPEEKYIYDPAIKKAIEVKKIKAYSDETSINVEAIIASGADIVLYSGFGDKFPNAEKLAQLGISTIPIYDWRENEPLGKAEWIKVIGAITNQRQEAEDYYNSVSEAYKALKAKITHIETRPKVLSGNLIGDVWWAPAGNSYVAKLIADAKGDYVFAKTEGTGSLSYSMEEILEAPKTDIWINPGFSKKSEIISNTPLAHRISSYQNVYCYSGNMNLFWERSAIEPHHVLEDLIRIFHPGVLADGNYYFYSKID